MPQYAAFAAEVVAENHKCVACLPELPAFQREFALAKDYESFKNELMQKSGLKGKNFFMPLRLVLTNSAHGPELSELYGLLKPFIKDIVRKD